MDLRNCRDFESSKIHDLSKIFGDYTRGLRGDSKR
jgi:hypothetical protein